MDRMSFGRACFDFAPASQALAGTSPLNWRRQPHTGDDAGDVTA